jgi:hypothetical protein
VRNQLKKRSLTMQFPSRAAIKQAFDIRLPAFLFGVLVGVAGMFAFLFSLPKGGDNTGPTDDPPAWQQVFVPETFPPPISFLARQIGGKNLNERTAEIAPICPSHPEYEVVPDPESDPPSVKVLVKPIAGPDVRTLPKGSWRFRTNTISDK